MSVGRTSLLEHDPEIHELIEKEKFRQWTGLELIASENLTSRAVMECLGSCLTNKYAEGTPFKRYYGGNEFIDQIESMCQERALKAYNLDPAKWGVNVQPYSGSPANFEVYTALLKPHDRIMGLDLPSGGHLTHGFYTLDKKTMSRKAVSATSIYFESLPYRTTDAGIIDYDTLAQQAALYKPAMIIAGGSAYPREFEYARFRKIADDNGSLLMMDMAHISGLVATGEAANPFDYCDIVTTTTHKTMRGPRSGMIFYRKDERDFETRICSAVFPGLQGGPHEHQIAAVATQLKEVATPEFKVYIQQVKANASALANHLISKYNAVIMSGGTVNHIVLWDLKPTAVSGAKMQVICDYASITVNKNTVLGDVSALSPGGVRLGSSALTTRGLKEADFCTVGDFLMRAVAIAQRIQAKTGKLLKDFEVVAKVDPEVLALKMEVRRFITTFPMPGFDTETMKYRDINAQIC